MIQVEVSNRQSAHAVDEDRLAAAVRVVLEGEGFDDGIISLAIVDDAAIHELNRRYLKHDYPTDVLSFLLDSEDGRLEGEIIVSADTAATAAPRYNWPAQEELLLYVVHGALHLAGYDDQTPAERQKMRKREKRYLTELGVAPAGRDEE